MTASPRPSRTDGPPGIAAQQLPWATAWYSITCSAPRHQQRRDLARRRRLGGPVTAAADVEEDRAAQAHAAQDVGQRVHGHRHAARTIDQVARTIGQPCRPFATEVRTRGQGAATLRHARARAAQKNRCTRRDLRGAVFTQVITNGASRCVHQLTLRWTRDVRQVSQSDVEAFASRISGGSSRSGRRRLRRRAQGLERHASIAGPALIARCRSERRCPRRQSRFAAEQRMLLSRARRRPPHRRQRASPRAAC